MDRFSGPTLEDLGLIKFRNNTASYLDKLMLITL